MSLDNIPSKYRSKLQFNHFVAIGKKADIYRWLRAGLALAETCPREQSLPNSARREQSLLRTRPREESLNSDSCPSLNHYSQSAPLQSDIKKLEKGIELLPSKTSHGCLIAFSGDNLASHSAGRFKEGFTALHPCRTCDAPLAMVRECVDVKKFVLRTEEAYQEQLQLPNAAPNQGVRLELSKDFGVNREPLQNELNFFSVVKN